MLMLPVRGDDLVVKKMAQLIRAGAKLTSYTCPACGTPLLQLKTGEYYCAKCDKPVVIVRSAEEEIQVAMRFGLSEVRDTVFQKIMMINNELKKIGIENVESLQELTRSLLLLLEAFERINKLMSELQTQEEAKKKQK